MSSTNTVESTSFHGHALRDLVVEVGRPVTEAELQRLVSERFGPRAKFHTCCQQNLSLADVLAFFVARGKIRLEDGRYSAEPAHECGGHGHDHARH